MRGILSLQKPLGNTENFTLEDILASPELLPDDAEYRRNGKKQGKQVTIDQETVDHLRLRFGNIPLGRAIRSLIGLPPLEKQEAWQVWEDDVIKEWYPCAGSAGVLAQDVKRSPDAIRARAQVLSVKAGNLKPNDEWLSMKEIASIFNCDYTLVWKWFNRGLIRPIAQLSNRHRDVFFTNTELIRFIEKYPFVYPHERITNGYRKYLPDKLFEYISTKEASKILSYSISDINNLIDKGHIACMRGFGRQRYVKLGDLRNYLNSPRQRKPKRLLPYKVIDTGERRHFVQQDDEGIWCLVCNKGLAVVYDPEWRRIGIKLRFSRGYPTCKNCLAILKRQEK